MQNKILGVAGCAALMLGLAACSGEDGVNGVNGLNGKNGADGKNGTSCEVKALKNNTGYKVLCAGDSVGVLKNGKDGTNGKAGTSCTTTERSDKTGFDVMCGGKSVGSLLNGKAGESCTVNRSDLGAVVKCGNQEATLLDGKSCTASTTSKNGREGIVVTCDGEVVGTVWNGETGTGCSATPAKLGDKTGFTLYCGDEAVGTVWNGTEGTSCTSTEKANGKIEVKCGDASAVTIYKAMCGDDSYDPAEQFCVLGKLYDKCDGKTFVVNREYCNDDVVAPLCSEVKLKKDGSYEVVANRATKADEFCLAGIITKKCGGEEFSMNQYCDKKHDGVTDSIKDYCKYADDEKLEMAYQKIGKSLFPEEEEEEDVEAASSSSSFFGGLIGKKLDDFTSEQLGLFYEALEGLKTTCGVESDPDLCGGVAYNPEKKFCDIRDNHLYAFKEINGVTWFTENLAFKYKLPKKVYEIDKATGDTLSISLDAKGGVLYYEDDPFENFEAAEGRYYTWNSAMGIGDMRSDVDLGETSLKDKDKVVGACPAGWRLPTKAELEDLSNFANDVAEGGFEDLDNTDKVLNFNVDFLGYYNISAKKPMGTEANFWSSDAAASDEQAWGLVIVDNDNSSVETSNKAYAYTIRCVKDAI